MDMRGKKILWGVIILGCGLLFVLVFHILSCQKGRLVDIEGWPDNWMPVVLELKGEYKLDYARKDKIYLGEKKSPRHIEISYKSDSGEMIKGAVPKEYLLSNKHKRIFLIPKE